MSSATSTIPKTSTDASAKKQLFLNLFTAAIIALVVLGCFYKTVFQGAPISRVYQLGQRDTLFGKYFTPQREGYDASVYQYFVPSHVFLTEQLRKGVIPLWNPLAGCGAPYLADVETAVFWPLRLSTIFLPPLRAWNLLLVMNILNFALGTFLLAKALQLRRFAVIYASLTCAFCPYLVFQSELIGSSASMIPLVMASFVYLQSSRTFIRTVLAGLACAVMILSGHPEPSFFGIVCASMLYLALTLFDKDSGEAVWKSMLKGFMQIGFVGCFAFGFCAFMLLPFLELLRNSDCYKLGLTDHRPGVPLNSILVNLIHPAYSNSSPYLGILCIPFILISAWQGIRNNRFVQALLACAVVSIALMSQLGPLDWLMNLKGFSWFVPKYSWPALLVMLSLLSAYGFQFLVTDIQKNWRPYAIAAVVVSLITLLSLGAIRVYPSLLECIRQDEAFEHMQVISKFWTRDLILLTVFGVIVTASRLLKQLQAAFIVLAVGVITVLSIAPVTRTASPITGPFNYDLIAPIDFLTQPENQDSRIVSMGRHVFCPSSNYCYGINNIIPVNVYHPSRFQQFLINCGVTPEGVNQFFDGRLSPIINTAALKYIVTPNPVLSKSDKLPEAQALTQAQSVKWGEGGLMLTGGALALSSSNREILGSLQFTVSEESARDLAWQAVVTDASGKNILWLGDTERFLYQFAKKSESESLQLTKDLAIPIPHTDGQSQIKIAIKVFDWKNMSYIPVTSKNVSGDQLVIAEADLTKQTLNSDLITSSTDTAERKFKLKTETDKHVRVYENTAAMPHAFLSRNCVLAKDQAEASTMLEKYAADENAPVILEPASGSDLPALQQTLDKLDKSKQNSTSDKVEFHRDNCNNISIKVTCESTAVLVLCENFYPGWQASLDDGKTVSKLNINHANYLFQSVALQPGSYTVRFKFEPAGFTLGLQLAALTALIALLYPAFVLFRTRRK